MVRQRNPGVRLSLYNNSYSQELTRVPQELHDFFEEPNHLLPRGPISRGLYWLGAPAHSTWTFNTQTTPTPYQTSETAMAFRKQEKSHWKEAKQRVWAKSHGCRWWEGGRGWSLRVQWSRALGHMVNLVRHKARDVGVHCVEEDSPELPLNSQASQLVII